MPPNTKISFFIAFSFSLVTFAIGCPKELHRKPLFEGAKSVSIHMTSVTDSAVNINTGQDFYDAGADASRLVMRGFCWLFYTSGLVLSVVLLIRAALYVYNA